MCYRIKLHDYHGHKAQYEKLYAQYRAIKKAGGFRSESKAQKALDTANAYYEEHRTEITLYEAAERYLKDVMQDHFDPKKLPPISKWEAESNKLKSERQQLSRRYLTLKEDVKEVERIQRSINNILREENSRKQPTRRHELDL